MILSLAYLIRWEWHKLRRRRMPWILLAIVITLSQIPFWTIRAFGEAFGGQSTAAPIPETVSTGLELGYQTSSILIIIWAASALGSEYGWGTLRTVLAKNPSRWQLLTAKFLVIAGMGITGLFLAGVLTGFSGLVDGLVLGDRPGATLDGEWLEVLEKLGKYSLVLTPYILITMFFVVLTSSAGNAMAITLAYKFLGEGLLLVLLTLATDRFDKVAEFTLGRAVGAWLTGGGPEVAMRVDSALGGMSQQAGSSQAFLTILGYTVLSAAAVLWLFLRKDIGGARGS